MGAIRPATPSLALFLGLSATCVTPAMKDLQPLGTPHRTVRCMPAQSGPFSQPPTSPTGQRFSQEFVQPPRTALITGIGAAVPTLRLSTGAIDHVAHQLLAAHLSAAKAKAILVAGTTGRGGSLSMSDRLDLTHASTGPVPVIVGVEPEISQEHVIDLAHAGAKALLVAFRSGADLQEAIELLSLCRTNGLEMIAYHHPSVHDPLPRQWWPALRELFVQVKNSDPDPQMLQDMINAGLSVLVGSSARLIDSYRATGVLSGIASVRFDLVEASADGDLDAHADLMTLEASLPDRISEIEHRARLLIRR